MRRSSIPWKATQYKNMFEQGSLSSDYPIQRGGSQWNNEQKSLFIHSLIEGYPIPNVLLLKREGDSMTYILDGKQRLTTLLDFLTGVKQEDGSYPSSAFRLDDDTPSAKIDSGEYEIGGMYFDELPLDVQTEAKTGIVSSTRLEEVTDEEIEELFYRWNNGTALSEQQKVRVLMGTENAKIFGDLTKHPFMVERASFTPTGRRRGEDEGVVLQSMMLLSGYDFKSLVAKQMTDYARSIRDSDITEEADILKQAFDFLYENTSNAKNVLYKKLHLPTLIMIGVNAMDEDYSKSLMEDWILDFSLAISEKTKSNARFQTNYHDYMGAGAVRKSKVEGRLTEMQKHFAEFAKDYVYGDSSKLDELTGNDESETPENHLEAVQEESNTEVVDHTEDATNEHSEAPEESEKLEVLPEGTEDHPEDYIDQDDFVQHEQHEENAIQLQDHEEVKN